MNGNQGGYNQPNQPGYNNNVYNNNSGFMNYVQGGGFGSPNYNVGQMGQNPNYGYNQNNRPPIPFSSNNMNRKFLLISEIIANGQKFAGESKKTLEKIKT